MDTLIEGILMFWFGPLNSDGLSEPEQQGLWFKSSEDTDAQCRELFGHGVERAVAGGLDHWVASDRGLVALVILLDQFTRNIYRGTGAAFSGDAPSQALVQQAIAEKRHLAMPAIHRVFLYLPLEHSEDLATQEHCVALYQELLDETGLQDIAGFCRYAVAHRDVIAQFGRFPHRNDILGRASTPAEIEHLASHGGF